MTPTVRRAGLVAGLCTLSLTVALPGPAVAGTIAAVLAGAGFAVRRGRLFEALALPADREDGRLNSLLLFVLAAVILGSLAGATGLTWAIVVGVVLLVGYGDLAEQLARARTDDGAVAAAAFCVGGGLAAVVGQVATGVVEDVAVTAALPSAVFLAASGAVFAAVLRERLPRYDDPLVLVAAGLLLWLLAELDPALTGPQLAGALGVMAALGCASYVLETASVAGMLAGVLLGLLTIVLGGWGWFAVLISFFAIGGLSTKYRYAEKAARGVAEDNDGARGSANVFSNSAVALVAVLGYAASDANVVAADPNVFRYAFAGAVATALSDTLSSEVGGVFDEPRLITTMEPVEPGTDGGVTWQGEVAGTAGAVVVAGIAAALFPSVGPVGFAVVVAAGVAGMTVDSVLGATVEGSVIGNQGVNFVATLAGATLAALGVFWLGIEG